MAAPAIGGTVIQNTSPGSNETTSVVTAPGGSAGDVIYIAMVSDLNTGQTFTFPAGFTKLTNFDNVNVNSAAGGAVARKTHTGSEPATYSVTLGTAEKQNWIAWTVSGDGGVDQQGVAGSGTALTATLPGLSVHNNDSLIFGVVFTDVSAGSTLPMTTSGGWIKLAEQQAASAGAVAIFYQTVPTATVVGPDNIGLAVSEQWWACTFVLNPVTGTNPSVFDTVTSAETVTITVAIPGLTISETINLAEVTTARLGADVRVSDAVAVTDSATIVPQTIINTGDTVTLVESFAADITYAIAVSDAIVVSEGNSTTIVSLVNVSDAIVVSETQALTYAYAISVSDAVAVGESKIVSIPGVSNAQALVSDAVALSETVTIATADMARSVSDAVAVTETVTMSIVRTLSVSDAITVAETIGRALGVTIAVSDAVALTESNNLGPATLAIHASDTVHVTESVTVISRFIQKSDAVTVTEAVTVAVQIQISVSDAVHVAEGKTVTPTISLAVADTVHVAESRSLVQAHLISVTDAVHVFDTAVTGQITGTAAHISDAVHVGELIHMIIVSAVSGNATFKGMRRGMYRRMR